MIKKKRIKFIALGLNLQSGGGANLTLDLMIRFLISQNFSVSLITTQDNNYPEVSYPIKSEKIFGKFLTVQKKIAALFLQEEKNCDLFIAYGPALIWGSNLYKKNGGKTPVIAFINNYLPMMNQSDLNSYTKYSKIKRQLFNLKLKIWYKLIGHNWINYINFYLFDSPTLLNIYKKYSFPQNKLGVLPEFIDITQGKKNNERHASGEVVRLLYVGRIIYDKGLDLLIEAISSFNDKALHLDIVGTGSEQLTLETLIKTKKLETMVSFYPWSNQNELINFYQKSDIFVHPCRWIEPFGRTIVEAMSYGLPIITTEGTGSAWVAKSAGLTFKNEDLADLGQKIKILVSNPDLRLKYSTLAKKRAEDFNHLIVGKQLIKKIGAVIGY